jgi:hypothetical protein
MTRSYSCQHKFQITGNISGSHTRVMDLVTQQEIYI